MSEQNKNRRFISNIEKMSTGELREMLRVDCLFSDDSSKKLNNDLILSISEVIARREKEDPNRITPDVGAAWKSFTENYLPYTDDETALYDFGDNGEGPDSDIRVMPSMQIDQPKTRKARRGLYRVSGIAAAMLIIMLLGTVTSYAFGYNLWGAVAQWTKDTFGFDRSVPVQGVPDSEYASLQEALDDYGISETLLPKFIPEDYALSSIEITETPIRTWFFATYSADRGLFAIDIKRLTQGVSTEYEKDAGNPSVYEAGQIKHYLLTNEAEKKAVWSVKNYECSISGNLTEAELKSMIDSIYES